MYKFPLRLPTNQNVIISQPFRSSKPIDISVALSKETTDHNGIDVICGTPAQTWGIECVWPFPWDGIVYDSVVNATFGATQAHAQIDTVDPSTGIAYSIIYLHLSSVARTKYPTTDTIIIYKQGETIGRIGNNGFVNPPPTPTAPLNGTHLHLGLGVKKPGEVNYTMVDALTFFDMNDPFRTQVAQFKFNKNLWIGMNNSDVLELQKRLGIDYSSGPGNFGPKTFSAVRAYQSSKRIISTGFVGPLTRAELNK